jgi:superfamily II DNA or RNA helicase
MSFDTLQEAVREACPRGLWSQGVKLARDGAVSQESATAAEVVLRVRASGKPIAPTVVLYPKDGEWECDCRSKFDACEHVAAAVIAVTQAATGAGGPALPERPRLLYRFARTDEGPIALHRVVVEGDRERPLDASLIDGVVRGDGRLQPTQADLAVDRLLARPNPTGTARPDAVLVARVLSFLAGCDRVSLDGAPVEVAADPLSPRAIVSDRGEGVRLAVVAHPALDEVVGDGVALSRGALVPLGHISVTGPRGESLPIVRDYAPSELGELATQMLPALRRDVEVEVRTRRLPRVSTGHKPRVQFELGGDAEKFDVMALIVYGDPPMARIDGDKLVLLRPPAPVRDPAAEKALVLRLRAELNLAPGHKVGFSGVDAGRMADKLRAFDGGAGAGGLTEADGGALFEMPLTPRLALNDHGDAGADLDLWFEVTPPGETTPRRAAAAQVVNAWRGGLELVPLLGGGWAPLPADFLARHGNRVADLLAARDNAGGKVAPAALPSLVPLLDELGAATPLSVARLKPLLEEGGELPRFTPPSTLRAELRPYQQVGTAWLHAHAELGLGAVLADDMGLGKTVMTLAALRTPALVVAPTSVVHNWAAETARFRPDLSINVYHGPRRALDRAADVTLTSYGVLRLDLEALAGHGFAEYVLDEAQAIKNPDSQAARAAYALPGGFRVALSGTPVENRLDELWSVVHFTNPGVLGPRRHFARGLATRVAAGDAASVAYLRQKLRPLVLRREKRVVAPELPSMTESVMYVELSDAERVAYDAVHAATRAEIVERLGGGASVLQVLEALLRLRQAACHPSLLPGQSAPTSAKLERLAHAVETAVADGHKALVFSQWTSLLDLIGPRLEQAGVPFARLDGQTRDRAGVVGAFQGEAGAPVLLSSLKAGGTGLNLTAADHVFLVDPWWNPAAEDQAAARAHRIGQDRPVMLYRLVARGTVEERILELQGKKRKLAEAALGGAPTDGGLTREDLLALFD